jgi:nucleotidyltransferase substrate binding protein (TIGR01987 family)
MIDLRYNKSRGDMVKLYLMPFEKALTQLEKSLSYLKSELARQDDELRQQFRAAAIQAFEYTYELSVKMLRRQLEQILANPAELREMAFMDLIRTAAEAGLVKDVAAFRIYREMRNITSYTYDENKAEQILAVLDQFVRDMHFILSELGRRNHEVD